MGILWLIIKIILLVLLALLCLLIIGVFIILISPISYEAYLEKYDDLIYDFKVTYLGVIRGHFCLEKGCKNHEIKAFGKVLYEDKVKNVDSEAVQGLKKEKIRTQESSAKENKTDKSSRSKVAKKESQPMKRQEQKAVQEKVKDKHTKLHDEKIIKAKAVNTPTMETIQEGSEEAAYKVADKTKKFTKNIDSHQIKEMLCSKDFWQLVKEIYQLLKHIIKYILPRQWSYEVVIGKEDPAETGELIAKLTMLYPLYYKHGILRGDFERSGLWGGFLAKGRFSLLGILKRIVIFLCKPVVRGYIKLILRIRKEENNGK